MFTAKAAQTPASRPLSDAFGKIDPAGPDDLTNSWLNIHPKDAVLITLAIEAVGSTNKIYITLEVA